jgi:hypothetical protein
MEQIQKNRDGYNAYFAEYLKLNYPDNGERTLTELSILAEIEKQKSYQHEYYLKHRVKQLPKKKTTGCIVIEHNKILKGCPF